MSDTQSSDSTVEDNQSSAAPETDNSANSEESNQEELVPISKLHNAEQAAKRYRTELREAKRQLEEGAKSESENSGSSDKLSDREKKYLQEIEQLKAAKSKSDELVLNKIVDEKRKELFKSLGVLDSALPQVVELTKSQIKHVEVSEGNFELETAEGVSEYNVQDFAKNWLQSNKHFLKPEGSNGTGNNGGAENTKGSLGGLPAGFEKWSQQEQVKHFAKMKPEERMAHMSKVKLTGS